MYTFVITTKIEKNCFYKFAKIASKGILIYKIMLYFTYNNVLSERKVPIRSIGFHIYNLVILTASLII